MPSICTGYGTGTPADQSRHSASTRRPPTGRRPRSGRARSSWPSRGCRGCSGSAVPRCTTCCGGSAGAPRRGTAWPPAARRGRSGTARSSRKTSASLPVLRTPSSVSIAACSVTTQSGRGSGPREPRSTSSQVDQRCPSPGPSSARSRTTNSRWSGSCRSCSVLTSNDIGSAPEVRRSEADSAQRPHNGGRHVDASLTLRQPPRPVSATSRTSVYAAGRSGNWFSPGTYRGGMRRGLTSVLLLGALVSGCTGTDPTGHSPTTLSPTTPGPRTPSPSTPTPSSPPEPRRQSLALGSIRRAAPST